MEYWNRTFNIKGIRNYFNLSFNFLFIFTIVFLTTFIISSVLSCKTVNHSSSAKEEQENEEEESSSNSSSNTTNMDFGVMDENYNFTNNSNYSASDLASRFPVQNTKVSYLNDEQDYFKYRLDLIDKAQDSIYIQTYILDDVETAWEIAKKLVEARQRGVEVKLIVDVSSVVFVKHVDLYNYLHTNGIEFRGYEVLLGYNLNTFSLDNFINTFNNRRHEKIFLIDPNRDDARAILGGTNIANEYFGAEPDNYELNWKDQDIAIKGKLVRFIADEFLKTWDKIVEEEQAGSVNVLGRIWNISKSFTKLFSIQKTANPNYLREDIVKRVEKMKKKKVTLNYKKAPTRYLYSNPKEGEDFIYQAYLDSINRAKESIDILSGYFIPPVELREAILEAVKRGVKVRILTNSPEISDLSLSMVAGRRFYAEILQYNDQATGDGSVKIYEWQGETGLGNGLGLNHGKYGIFDNKLLIIGSFNLDPRSKNLNSESVIVTEAEEAIQSLEEKYQSFLDKKYSIEVDLEKAKTFKKGSSLSDAIFKNFAKDLTFLL